MTDQDLDALANARFSARHSHAAARLTPQKGGGSLWPATVLCVAVCALLVAVLWFVDRSAERRHLDRSFRQTMEVLDGVQRANK